MRLPAKRIVPAAQQILRDFTGLRNRENPDFPLRKS
jgi:hypothetical protein